MEPHESFSMIRITQKLMEKERLILPSEKITCQLTSFYLSQGYDLKDEEA